jgi:hypothetical protein
LCIVVKEKQKKELYSGLCRIVNVEMPVSIIFPSADMLFPAGLDGLVALRVLLYLAGRFRHGQNFLRAQKAASGCSVDVTVDVQVDKNLNELLAMSMVVCSV